jgi:colanic acid biosynthesis protein WcaH
VIRIAGIGNGGGSTAAKKPSMTDHSRVSDDIFGHIVRWAPLVSLDLIIKDPKGRVLVGPQNQSAGGWYFVPGGVIRKNETIEHAFTRILQIETGFRAALDAARLLGVFQHFYPTNRFGDPGYGTHYVVLAYELPLPSHSEVIPDAQHAGFKWMTGADLIAAADVHQNTRAYLRQF